VTKRPFRFGVDLHGPLPGRTWTDSAREIESLGYSTLFVPDHFDVGPGPITGMAAAAAVTSTLRVGSLVFACDFRHPAVIARELTSIDVLSEGRLEVGIGAGWKRFDYERTGIAMDPPKIRVDRMIEYVQVLKALFGGEPVTFHGEHYRITELPGTPRPHTPGGPPILVGGGARRVLRYAGATADIVGINATIRSGEIDREAARDGMPDRFDQKVAWIREGAAGRAEAPELNAWLGGAEVTDEATKVAELLAFAMQTTPESVLQSPLALIGTISECVDILEERRDRWGLSYIVIPGARARDFAPLVAKLTGS
jgi:probable F420-dependent oxidoreductase